MVVDQRLQGVIDGDADRWMAALGGDGVERIGHLIDTGVPVEVVAQVEPRADGIDQRGVGVAEAGSIERVIWQFVRAGREGQHPAQPRARLGFRLGAEFVGEAMPGKSVHSRQALIAYQHQSRVEIGRRVMHVAQPRQVDLHARDQRIDLIGLERIVQAIEAEVDETDGQVKLSTERATEIDFQSPQIAATVAAAKGGLLASTPIRSSPEGNRSRGEAAAAH